jgi:hypothetical protein
MVISGHRHIVIIEFIEPTTKFGVLFVHDPVTYISQLIRYAKACSFDFEAVYLQTS